MAIVINTKSYARDISTSANATPYIGPSNTVSIKDFLAARREPAKATSAYSGTARGEMKLKRTANLVGSKTTTGEAIAMANIAIPVGMTTADIDTLLTDFATLVASADFKTFVKSHAFPA